MGSRIIVNRDLRTLEFNPIPISLANVLSPSDPLGVPLEAMIRVRVMRRDSMIAFPGNNSWSPLFDSVDRAIDSCVASIDERKAIIAKCPEIEQRFNLVRQQIRETAESMDLSEVLTRGPGAPWAVKLVFTPTRVRLRLMTMLEYKKCVFFHLPLDPVWVDLLQDEENLIGRYHYRAEWPSNLGGPKEGDFEIKSAATLKFHPE